MAVIDNLVAYWSLDEASGDAIDAHGANDLADNNTVSAATGLVSGCRAFAAASSEYFSLADNTDLSTGDIDFSFALWIKLATNTTQVILGKDVDTPGSSRDYTIDTNVNTPRFYINGGGGGLLVNWSGTFATTGVWYFLACGHSASSDELWISVDNGTPVTQATGGTAPQDSGAPFRLGARAYASFEGYLDASLDEVGMWKRDIRSDLTWLYNSGSGRSYADIVAEGPPTGQPSAKRHGGIIHAGAAPLCYRRW